jgi:hypothetical protein
MQHRDFAVGATFYTATGPWRCTDKGRRTIVAVPLWTDVVEWCAGTETHRAVRYEEDPTWWNGPPYAVGERVFDEYDFTGCREENE